MRALTRWRYAWCAAALLLATAGSNARGQGVYVSAAGPVSRGMGGATTAAPIDALGALYWNPATITGLDHSELSVGLDLLFSDHDVSSTFGPFSGSTHDKAGVFPLPNVGWVHRTNDCDVTIGLGINSVAGFKTNLPSSPGNPALSPPPNGLGQVSSEASFLQMTPVVSLRMTEKLSFAIGPVITLGQVGIEPFVFDTPNLNGTYPAGRASRYHWGGGVQAGVYYVKDRCWQFGASIKSPAWMEEFEFFGVDETGAPRTMHADIDLPMILSFGLAYTGIEDVVLAMDARFFDYDNTDGFGDPAVFNAGALGGLGWDSVFALALGAQKHLTRTCSVRAGYTYNQNPIGDSESFFNVAAPLLYEHMVSAGASWKLSDTVALNLGYSYYIDNSITGPIVSPVAGPVAGSSVTNDLSAHMLSFGVIVRN